jgi:hypothetical protein
MQVPPPPPPPSHSPEAEQQKLKALKSKGSLSAPSLQSIGSARSAMSRVTPQASEFTDISNATSPKQESGKKPQLLQHAIELPQRSFKIPESVYGGAAMCGILFDVNNFGEWMQYCGEAWFRLLFSHLVQSACMYGLWTLTVWQQDEIEKGTECWKIHLLVFIVCEAIFIMSILTEVFATFDMWELIIFHVPDTENQSESEPLMYTKDEDSGELILKSGGMSRQRKYVIVLIVLVPRLILAVVLLVIGGVFLQSANSNTDLFMNSLAANFVIEIDEMIFQFLTPDFNRRLIAEIPPFEKAWEDSHSNRLCLCLVRFWSLIKFSICAILVYIFWATAQGCPRDCCEGTIGICPLLGLRWYVE